MNPITFKFEPAKLEMADAALVFMYQRTFVRVMVRTMQTLVLATLFLFMWLSQKTKLEFEHAVFLSLALLIAFFHKKINRFILRWRFKKTREAIPQMELVFDDAGIKVGFNNRAKNEIDWIYIKRIKVSPAGWVICFKKQQFLFIPKIVLDDEVKKQALIDLFKEKNIPVA